MEGSDGREGSGIHTVKILLVAGGKKLQCLGHSFGSLLQAFSKMLVSKTLPNQMR